MFSPRKFSRPRNLHEPRVPPYTVSLHFWCSIFQLQLQLQFWCGDVPRIHVCYSYRLTYSYRGCIYIHELLVWDSEWQNVCFCQEHVYECHGPPALWGFWRAFRTYSAVSVRTCMSPFYPVPSPCMCNISRTYTHTCIHNLHAYARTCILIHTWHAYMCIHIRTCIHLQGYFQDGEAQWLFSSTKRSLFRLDVLTEIVSMCMCRYIHTCIDTRREFDHLRWVWPSCTHRLWSSLFFSQLCILQNRIYKYAWS